MVLITIIRVNREHNYIYILFILYSLEYIIILYKIFFFHLINMVNKTIFNKILWRINFS